MVFWICEKPTVMLFELSKVAFLLSSCWSFLSLTIPQFQNLEWVNALLQDLMSCENIHLTHVPIHF